MNENDPRLKTLPQRHRDFLRAAIPRFEQDRRIVGVAAGGSLVVGGMDDFSDLDLVVAVEPKDLADAMRDRQEIAAALGRLLAAFTGEHVGEPRLLICLYGDPLLHVDLKFVSLEDVGERVEEPIVLWEREGRLSTALGLAKASPPRPDVQWIEDRFWVWIHYAAVKIGRGELYEVHDFLAFLRSHVLGPLALYQCGARPFGVRKIEFHAPDFARRLRSTIADYSAVSCAAAVGECARLYRELRAQSTACPVVRREEAETAAMSHFDEVKRGLDRGGAA